MSVIGALDTRPRSGSIEDGYLDQGVRGPITARPLWIAIRSCSLVAASAVAIFLPGIPRHLFVASILALAALAQPLVPRVASSRHASVVQAVSDIIVITAVVLAAPSLWPASMVWLGATIAWQAITSPTKLVLPLGLLALISPTLTGLAGGVRYWWTSVIIMLVMGTAFAMLGRRLRIEFRVQEQDLMLTLTRAGAIVHHTDVGGGSVRQVSGDIKVLTGWTPAEWTAIDHRSLIHPDDLDGFWLDPERVHNGMVIDRTCRMRRPDGSWVWIRDVSRVSIDRRGVITLHGFSLDVTELEEANRTITAQARLDPLTGLPNRMALNERLAACVDAGADYALMLIDLDRFKEVNDTLGHEAGDTMLQVVSDRIGRALRPNEFLGRLGGDEFAILIDPASESAQVVECIDRIAFECSQPLSLQGVRVAVSLSIGVAFGVSGAKGQASVLRQADIAMYAAKRAGSTYRIFDESLEQTSTAQLSLSAMLPDAIANGEFELHFQPKVDLATGCIVGAEGLARWNHPERGVLGPVAFLDVATMSDSASVFARTMIEQGVIMAKRLMQSDRPLPIAVNITMRVVHEDDFSAWLFATLGRHGVPPQLLVLELTERDVQDPSPQAIATIDELTEAGIELSIDDFGTGHSSMQRLRQLRVAELKIDRTFVEGIVDNSVDREIVGSIIELATRLGYRVIAEGVEQERDARLLFQMGCTIAQGFLFARALAPDDFHQMALGPGMIVRTNQPTSADIG